MADAPISKTCARCRENKPLDCFHGDKRRKDGRFPYCKPCVCALRKSEREMRGDEIRQAERERRKQNLGARLAVERRACAKRRSKAGYRGEARAAATRRLYDAYIASETTRCCEVCGVAFCNVFGRHSWMMICSDACSMERDRRRNIAKEKARRARKRAVRYEVVDVFKVFERDGYRCQLCGKKTLKGQRGTAHPRAPELDHIVPLSDNGEHTYRNTQTACRSCNRAKSDGPGGQLRLFG